MIDIFQFEISALDAELMQLQALLESKRKEQSILKELGFEANSTIAAIAKLKEKVEAVKSDAIATLKAAVLNLFDGGDDDDGGNQPTDPQPDPEPIWENLTAAVGIGGELPEVEIVPDEEIVDFEDASQQETIEENPTAAGEALEEDSGEDAIIHHPDNAAIAWIANPENEKFTVFLGFARKAVAKSWQRFIEPMAAAVELGEAEILEGFKWELYCHGLSMSQVSQLAECDFTKKHHAEIGTTTPPQSMYRFQPPAIQIGSRVTKLNSEEIFEVTSEVANKIFFAKSIVTGERKLFSIEDVHILSEPLPEGTPLYATVLLAECPWKGEKLQIVAEGEGGYTLATPQGNYWYRRDCVELFDETIEAVADLTEPVAPSIQVGDRVKLSSPCSEAYREFEGMEMEVVRFVREDLVNCLLPTGDWRSFALNSLCLLSAKPAPDTHSILSVGDIVRVLSHRHPEFVRQTCEIYGLNDNELPIFVKRVQQGTHGIEAYSRSELELISKADVSKADVKNDASPAPPLPEKPSIPVAKSTDSELADTHSILGVGDTVQILSDRYAQYVDHVGTVIEIIPNSSLPICVKAPRGVKPYHRQDLKLVSKAVSVEPEKELVAAGQELDF